MAPTTLLNLPTELLLQIGSYLGYCSYIAFYMSCRLVHYILPTPPNDNLDQALLTSHPDNVTNKQMYNMLDLLQIEEWPCHTRAKPRQLAGPGDYFACCYCLKIRSAIFFSNAMMKKWYGKASLTDASSLLRLGRFCIPCGIKDGRYELGEVMYFGGAKGGLGAVCKGCSEFVRNPVRVARLGYICGACKYTLELKPWVFEASSRGG